MASSRIIDLNLQGNGPLLSFVFDGTLASSASLADAVSSALRQTRPDVEILIVANPDRPLAELPLDDQRVRLLAPQDSLHDEARSDFIALADSRDLLLPDYAESMVSRLIAAEGCELAYSLAWSYEEAGKRFRRSTRPAFTLPRNLARLRAAIASREIPLAPVLVRRRALRRHGHLSIAAILSSPGSLIDSVSQTVRVPGHLAVRRGEAGVRFAAAPRLILPPAEVISTFPRLAEFPRPVTRLDRLLRREVGEPDLIGSEYSFSPPVGRFHKRTPVPGYYIDFRIKVQAPDWPVHWLPPPEKELHVAVVQWGLGAFEHYLAGAGEEFKVAALACADHLLESQAQAGPQRGGWIHRFAMPHTYPLKPPWLSAITQGEAASFMARLYLETGEERYADSAQLALEAMLAPVADGGTLTMLDGRPYVEEYPTRPGSFVLNGAIFGIWGFYDVGHLLDDARARGWFDQLATTLADNIDRYDTGRWSQYDLYPHRLTNVASPAYHLLHIRQLKVLAEMTGHPKLPTVIDRFESYRASPARRARAIGAKVAFRLLSPRNRELDLPSGVPD